jgi:hypothetical protein
MTVPVNIIQPPLDRLCLGLQPPLDRVCSVLLCRKGYMELDRMMQPSHMFIKGECVETVSTNDREAFPNQLE